MSHFNIYWLILGLIISFFAFQYVKGNRLRKAVFSNLDNAYVNGSFAPGEYLHGYSPDDIAYDLTLYSSDFDENGTRPETLTPYVRQWLRQKGDRIA